MSFFAVQNGISGNLINFLEPSEMEEVDSDDLFYKFRCENSLYDNIKENYLLRKALPSDDSTHLIEWVRGLLTMKFNVVYDQRENNDWKIIKPLDIVEMFKDVYRDTRMAPYRHIFEDYMSGDFSEDYTYIHISSFTSDFNLLNSAMIVEDIKKIIPDVKVYSSEYPPFIRLSSNDDYVILKMTYDGPAEMKQIEAPKDMIEIADMLNRRVE